MFKKMIRLGAAALLACVTVAGLSVSAQAQEKHDSNTLHKLGKAIQYPIRKASENASVDAHRAEGRKSVVHRRNGNKTYRAIIRPEGGVYRRYRVGHPHHHHHRK